MKFIVAEETVQSDIRLCCRSSGPAVFVTLGVWIWELELLLTSPTLCCAEFVRRLGVRSAKKIVIWEFGVNITAVDQSDTLLRQLPLRAPQV